MVLTKWRDKLRQFCHHFLLNTHNFLIFDCYQDSLTLNNLSCKSFDSNHSYRRVMELLCPAGNLPALKTAFEYGADAAYIGLKDETNARHFPGLNFTEKRLQEAIKITRNFRSEEHTSELQSRFDLVCRLLLEKK